MGSPYHVHTHVNSIHVVRTEIGFVRTMSRVLDSMGDIPNPYDCSMSRLRQLADPDNYTGPEGWAIKLILDSYDSALAGRARAVVFLEARYEWRNWEKFQRVIVLDFTQKGHGRLP